MADDATTQTIRSINWREVFPFTHLFRAFRIAVHPSKLLLALAALLLIYLGGRVLDGVWPDRYLVTRNEFRQGLVESEMGGGAAGDQAAALRDFMRAAVRGDVTRPGMGPAFDEGRPR